jgi:hypothetical protein
VTRDYYQHIELEQRGAVRWLWLNRPRCATPSTTR